MPSSKSKFAGMLAVAGLASTIGTMLAVPAAHADSNPYKAFCQGEMAGYDYTNVYTADGQPFSNQGQCVDYANHNDGVYVPVFVGSIGGSADFQWRKASF